MSSHTVLIPADTHLLEGELVVPPNATAVVLFTHGSGSSRFSHRNRAVAEYLQNAGLATLLFDLLTPAEDLIYPNRFDIALLARRLLAATDWAQDEGALQHLPIGYFGASTGAAAALRAAAVRPEVCAIVSRGGRPDLASADLPNVCAATLLIVGGDDSTVVELNRAAFARLRAPRALEIVPGAGHLFEEPGALDRVARLAAGWFRQYTHRTALA